jgi:hypothetical protein
MATQTQTTTPTTETWSGGMAVRGVLTLLGAGGLIVGAFLDWINGIAGTQLAVKALWSTNFATTNAFFQTAGFVMIVIGALSIVSLAAATGWLTRLIGALGIVAFIMFAIEVYRATGDQVIQAGAWVGLGGAVVVLIAGFSGVRRTTTTVP